MAEKIANVAKMSSEELHAYRWELTSKTCECTKLKRISSLMQIVQMDEMHSLLHAYMIGVRQNCRNCKNVAFTPRVHDRGEKGIGKYFPSISLLHAQEIFSYAFSLKTLALLDTKLPNMRGWVTECELMHIRDTATQAHNGGFLPKRL